jgi:small subunit ribosomal protein S1
MTDYLPEGELITKEENKYLTSSISMLRECIAQQRRIEVYCVVCDNEHNLIVDFGFIRGVIPRIEGCIGIEDGSTRDIALISRVNKPVCCIPTGFSKDKYGRDIVILSRKKAQEECLNNYIYKLNSGDVINVKVTHLEQFGAFVDVGCGLPSLIPIDSISVSRISHPSDRFYVGQNISAVVKSLDGRKISLSHKELLGTWEENAAFFHAGETVAGIIRSIENYGVFVELTPNLAGLAELRDGVRVNHQASVYIKAIIPEKMKIKLIIVDSFPAQKINYNYTYFVSKPHIDVWTYSTKESDKLIQTVF